MPRGPAPRLERPYRPPADGRLAEQQVQAFVAEARAIRRLPARSASSDSDPEVESFGRGRASDEYLWVKQAIHESEMRIDEREAVRREIEIDRKAVEALAKAAWSSTDPATKELLSRQTADLNRRASELERASLKKRPSPEETANDALVARYRRQIDAAELGEISNRT